MRPPVPAALVLFLAFLPSCIIASKNASTAHDVEKPPSDPPIPESVLTTVDFDAQGISEPVYEAPRDRAFIIRDLRVSEVVDVLVELPGVPATEQLPTRCSTCSMRARRSSSARRPGSRCRRARSCACGARSARIRRSPRSSRATSSGCRTRFTWHPRLLGVMQGAGLAVAHRPRSQLFGSQLSARGRLRARPG